MTAAVLAWLANSTLGRICAAVIAAGAAILGALALGRSQGKQEARQEARAEQAEQTIATMEKADEAAADYRADGAAKRLRNHSF